VIAYKSVGNGQAIFVCDKKTLETLTNGANLSDSIKVNRISSHIMEKTSTLKLEDISPIEKPA